MFEQAEYALATSVVLRSIGTGSAGVVGYNPADPKCYQEAIHGQGAHSWRTAMLKESNSVLEHDVIEWVDPPKEAQPTPSRILYRWKYDPNGVPNSQKSKIVVQGFPRG